MTHDLIVQEDSIGAGEDVTPGVRSTSTSQEISSASTRRMFEVYEKELEGCSSKVLNAEFVKDVREFYHL